jgi:hypothetical protein
MQFYCVILFVFSNDAVFAYSICFCEHFHQQTLNRFTLIPPTNNDSSKVIRGFGLKLDKYYNMVQGSS